MKGDCFIRILAEDETRGDDGEGEGGGEGEDKIGKSCVCH